MSFDDLPLEILDKIAAIDEPTYCALLGIHRFAKSLTPGRCVDFMIGFGHTVEITNRKIVWLRNCRKHRLNGPAKIRQDGSEIWWRDGKHHRANGPAAIYKFDFP